MPRTSLADILNRSVEESEDKQGRMSSYRALPSRRTIEHAAALIDDTNADLLLEGLVYDELRSHKKAREQRLNDSDGQGPVANDDLVITRRGVPVVAHVLDNDRRIDPMAQVVMDDVETKDGTWAVNTYDGSVVFTPATDFVGKTTAEYMVVNPDGTFSSANVTVVVREYGDHRALTHVGRPTVMPVRAHLILMLACAMAGLSVSPTQIHTLLVSNVLDRRKLRALLGLPTDPGYHQDKKLNERRREIHYATVCSSLERFVNTFDPRVYRTRKGLTRAALNAIDAKRDPEEMAAKQRRSNRLQGLLLIGTFRLLPQELQDRWKGDLTADGTNVPIHGRNGHYSQRRQDKNSDSPEANGGYAKKQKADRRDPGKKHGKPGFHAYEAHLSVTVGRPWEDRVPPLVMAFALDRPGKDRGLNVAYSLDPLIEAGLPRRDMVVDQGYQQLRPENWAAPIRSRGFGLVHTFKDNEIGIVQANFGGIKVVEGGAYADLPKNLQTAERDFRNKLISKETRDIRIKAREAFEVRIKEIDDKKVVYRSPGAGPGRTVICPLRTLSPRERRQEQRAIASKRKKEPIPVLEHPDAETAGPICTNKESVTLRWNTQPGQDFLRYLTSMPYLSPAAQAFYAYARNEVEGKNGVLKNDMAMNIAAAGQRRVRGWGKQYFALLVKCVAANIEVVLNTIRLYRTNYHLGRPPTPQPVMGRPADPGLGAYRPPPRGPTDFIIGGPRKMKDGEYIDEAELLEQAEEAEEAEDAA